MSASQSRHFRRRDGIFWFRRRVPAALVPRVGLAEIHRSLRTACPREAARRARRAWLVTDELFDEMSRNRSLAAEHAAVFLRRLVEEPVHQSPTADGLVQAFEDGESAYAKMFFNEAAADLVLQLPPEQRAHVYAHMRSIADRIELHAARLGQAVNGQKAEAALRRARAAEGLLAEADRALAEEEVSRQVAAELRQIAAENPRPTAVAPAPAAAAPPFAPAPAVPVVAPPPPEPPAAERAPLLSARVEGFFTAKRYPAHTEHQNRATVRLWTEIVGDKPTDRYTEEDAYRFQAALRQLPASHGKGGHVHALKAIEAANKAAAEKGREIPRLSEKTIERHFSLVRQLWRHLGKRVADQDIFDAVEHKVVDGERLPWSAEQLDRLLRARWNPADRRGNRIPEETHAWLVGVGGYTGARAEEIARLRVRDVEEIDGVHFFIIREQVRETEGGHRKREWMTKSPAGERAVAIHPKLLEAGILDLAAARLAAGAERLFELPSTGPNGNLAAHYSREFSRHKQSIGVPDTMVFHSFRHNVETILGNQKFPQRWIDVALGHSSERAGAERRSVGLRVYFHGLQAENLNEMARAIAYPEHVCPLLLLRRVRGEVPWE